MQSIDPHKNLIEFTNTISNSIWRVNIFNENYLNSLSKEFNIDKTISSSDVRPLIDKAYCEETETDIPIYIKYQDLTRKKLTGFEHIKYHIEKPEMIYQLRMNPYGYELVGTYNPELFEVTLNPDIILSEYEEI